MLLAEAFYEMTDVDSLAVSIGTAYGVYKSAGTTKLDFEIPHNLAEALSIPFIALTGMPI